MSTGTISIASQGHDGHSLRRGRATIYYAFREQRRLRNRTIEIELVHTERRNVSLELARAAVVVRTRYNLCRLATFDSLCLRNVPR